MCIYVARNSNFFFFFGGHMNTHTHTLVRMSGKTDTRKSKRDGVRERELR